MVRCKTCRYYSYKTHTCDYMLRRFDRRGCPVDACDKYEPNHLAGRLAQYCAAGGGLSGEKAELLRLYDLGLTDYEIAAVMERPRSTITQWRVKMGLPSQKCLREESVDDA